jgi:zinc transporter ZupT
MFLLVATTAVALLAAVLGVWLTGASSTARRMVAFGGGLLAGIAIFGVLPELAGGYGWRNGSLMLASGFGLLWLVNRYVYPVCPTCAHTHDHGVCSTVLHGFGGPLVIAAILHSALDGWGIMASQQTASSAAGAAVAAGILLHKVPEGLAFGSILRAAYGSRRAAMMWCLIAEGMTMAGGLLENSLSDHLGAIWLYYPLALAGGGFLFLGLHAVHEEWRRRGLVPACMPALTGAAGAAALHQGLRLFLH